MAAWWHCTLPGHGVWCAQPRVCVEAPAGPPDLPWASLGSLLRPRGRRQLASPVTQADPACLPARIRFPDAWRPRAEELGQWAWPLPAADRSLFCWIIARILGGGGGSGGLVDSLVHGLALSLSDGVTWYPFTPEPLSSPGKWSPRDPHQRQDGAHSHGAM